MNLLDLATLTTYTTPAMSTAAAALAKIAISATRRMLKRASRMRTPAVAVLAKSVKTAESTTNARFSKNARRHTDFVCFLGRCQRHRGGIF